MTPSDAVLACASLRALFRASCSIRMFVEPVSVAREKEKAHRRPYEGSPMETAITKKTRVRQRLDLTERVQNTTLE